MSVSRPAVEPFIIPLENLSWEEVGRSEDPGSRLVSVLKIGGLDMRLEAIAVVEEDFGNKAVCPDRLEYLDDLEYTENADFHTLKMNDRAYVLVALPFAH